MPAFDVARRWRGRVVLDRTGDKLGSVLDVFYGNELRVPYDRAFVEAAPGMEPGGRLWPQEEAELYAYYGLPYTAASMADLDEEDEDDAVAPLRGLPPGP